MSNLPIVLEVSLTPGDLYFPFHRSARNIYSWFVVCLFIFLAVELANIPGKGLHPLSQPWSFLLLVVIAILAGLAWPYLRIAYLFRHSRALTSRRRIEITPEGVRMESENARGEYRWPLFFEIEETPRAFLLKQTPGAAVYLPKRCFTSTDEIARFRALLRAQYSGRLRLRFR